ncbi:glycoside hydrolase family 26 protein [Rugosimonospora africana]|uniref:GH26 domain-containing protein n=1 Tax=Rugosimonospora africana TaxID=556532 RepID=A0A8J3QQD3_9ACTN|nr:glycosyl hydrolase [Rugosimonospora africana]GIH13867.1 hypothetical protein Raf01_20390 [Rugosimonospora africana]
MKRLDRPLRRLATGAVLAVTIASLVACAQEPATTTSAAWVRPGASAAASGAPAPAGSGDTSGAKTGSTKPEPTPGKVMLGEYIDLKGQKSEQDSLALRRQQLGRQQRIIHEYYDWYQPMPTSLAGLPAGSILLISWSGTFYAPITNGSQDQLIAKAADALASLKAPVFLRWAWEMNGNWYDWGGAENGKNPGGFIAAWRHIHDIFVAHKADNVSWVWGPNAGSVPQSSWNNMANYYPGDNYVDWVAVSGYFTGRETPASLFSGITSKYGAHKPVMIAETGALERGGTVKADWIRALQSWIEDHPAVGALVWFDTDNDHNNGKNWRIDSSQSALSAYRALATDPHFSG